MIYNDLYKSIGYNFKNVLLLKEALTHPSITNSNHDNNHHVNYQRLEFFGDSVLSFIITEFLITKHPSENEGSLAKRRSSLVCKDTLAQIGKSISLGDYIMMTEGEEHSGGRTNANNLENTLEALIGAIYLDGGVNEAKKFIYQFWLPIDQEMKSAPRDPKTSLQEWAQKLGKKIPQYNTIDSKGPSHSPLFTIEVIVEGLDPVSSSASSKKLAERLAAEKLLKQIIDTDH